MTGRISQAEQAATVAALRAAMRDAGAPGCDWLSSRPSKVKHFPVDLTEVCGGSGWYHRPDASSLFRDARLPSEAPEGERGAGAPKGEEAD